MKTRILILVSAILFLTISAKADELVLDTLWHQDYKNSIVGSYSLSPDGRFFVVGLAGSSFKSGEPGIPAKIQIFDAVTGELIREFRYEVPQNPDDNGFLNYATIMFSEAGDKLYIYYLSSNIAEFQRRQLVIHDFETGEPLRTLYSVEEAYDGYDQYTILLDDHRILTWNEAGLINVIDVEQDKIVYTFQLTYLKWNANVIYDKVSNLIATSGRDFYFDEFMGESGYTRAEIHLYDGTTYEWRGRLFYNHYQWDIEDTVGSDVWIYSLRFSDDGKYLVSSKSGSIINLWDLNVKKAIDTIDYPLKGAIYATLLSNNNMDMLIASHNQGVFISNYNFNLKEITKKAEILERYTFIDKSPDDKIIYIKGASALFAIHSPWQTVSVKDDSKPADNIIYPNPTSGNAEIKFDLKIADAIEVIVSDATGKIISHFPHKIYTEGQHLYLFDTNNMKSGMYIVNLKGKHINLNFKLQIIK